MTPDEAVKELESIRYRYSRERNCVEARERLQTVFISCFTAGGSIEKYKPALDKAYSLLRHIENGSSVTAVCPYRYDVSAAGDELVYAVNTLLGGTGRHIAYGFDFDRAFVSMELRSFAYAVLSLVSNALSYSQGGDIRLKLSVFDGFVSLSVTDNGRFPTERFRVSMDSDGSLGYVNRLMNAVGGSVVMTNGRGTVTVALKIPTADSALPCTLPLSGEDLLCDRLSVLYTAFCGH